MVLLTSSAATALISSTVVCIFTFFLFLSGYVLQQQTVRSLQEALRQPPPLKPTPTLPLAFQTAASSTANTLESFAVETGTVLTEVNVLVQDPERSEDLLEEINGAHQRVNTPEAPTRDGPQASLFKDEIQIAITRGRLQEPRPVSPLDPVQPDLSPQPQSTPVQSIAYILSLLDTSSLCSALLFARHHTSATKLPSDSRPPIIILYPSTWETNPTQSTRSALSLLLSALDSPSGAFGHLVLHPAPVSFIWSGKGALEGQMLAELQRGRFTYDRMMYLRLPGLVIDIPTLDAALSSSDLRRSWSPISSVSSKLFLSAMTDTISPPIMLVSPTLGLLLPRSNLRHLTTSISTDHASHHESEMDVEAKAASKGAAWVLFDETELEHRRGEKEWYGGVVEKFLRGRRDICLGTGLLGE